ncbi:hypothetical protein [Streptomyces sp. NPDC002580]|uniref:hypothetical protein n=1 Tax=Streptomyces sp. NPDC002580 TaxID=3364653 RepID=UPI0036D1BF9E
MILNFPRDQGLYAEPAVWNSSTAATSKHLLEHLGIGALIGLPKLPSGRETHDLT